MMPMATDESVTDQSFMSNPFYNVLQTTADHVQQTCTSAAAEYRAAAIRRFLKKRKRPEARRISTSRERTVDSSRQHNRDATATTTENGSNGSEEKRSLSSRAQATDE